MKLIIAGGRDYRLTNDDRNRLDELERLLEVEDDFIDMVISGGCRGCDDDGEAWAHSRDIPIQRFIPDWKLGPKAGPLRNAAMAAYADAVVLFPGGKGTQSMFDEATKAGIGIFDWRKDESNRTSKSN